MKLAVTYTIFAIAATLFNLASQVLFSQLYRGLFNIEIALLIGTLVGLMVKYLLDKKYIFQITTQSLRQDGYQFMLYSMMGLITTLLFWGTELSFEYLFHTPLWRYLGGALGLSIGYYSKYHLDKRFVFCQR